MSGADDTVYEQDEQVATRLVLKPDEVIEYTDVRTTDVWQAGVVGLCEYLKGKSIQWGATSHRLIHVFDSWSEPEDLAEFPSACAYVQGDGEFDYPALTPQTDTLPDGRVIRIPAEFSAQISLEVWCSNKSERAALCAMIEDLFNPVDWMAGFRLVLPFYHNAICTYLPQSMSISDSSDQAGRRWWLATFSIDVNLPHLKLVGSVPTFDPRLDLSVYDDASEYAQAVST